MEFGRMTEKLDYVSQLPDRPTAAEGYTPEVLKGIFDRAGKEIKAYLNEILLKELEATGAGASASEKLGSAAIEGLTGRTVYKQLSALKALADADKSELKADIQKIVSGSIPAGTIGESKLDAAVKALLHAHEGMGLAQKSFTRAGTYSFAAPRKGVYRFRMAGAGGAGTLVNPKGQALGTYECGGGGSGAYGEFTLALEKDQKVSITVGAGGKPAGNYSVGQVLSASEYESDYIGNRLYAQGGKDTEVIIDGTRRVVAQGGDVASDRVGVKIYSVDGVITGSGRPGVWAGERLLSVGADSPLGQGADRDGISPGIGAGGAGGQLYFGEDVSFTVRALPTAGGDGGVIIDYMGGEGS